MGSTEMGLLAASRRRLHEMQARLAETSDPPARARLLLDLGRHDEALAQVPGLLATGNPSQAAAILFAVHDYEQLAPLIDDLTASEGEDPAVRSIVYRWWYAIDNLEQVEQTVERRRASGTALLADALAGARLLVMMHQHEAAQEAYEEALGQAQTSRERALVLHGLGVVLHRRLDFDGSLTRLQEALNLTPLDPDLLATLSNTLIRLSRTDEAIDLLEMAVHLAPYHENAHYFLGNGYGRKNYRQLREAFPLAFADGDGGAALARASRLLAAGKRQHAFEAYQRLHQAEPGWADVSVHLGSLAFAERRYGEARRHFAKALKLCPEYGRAHNGLAKTLEAERSRHNAHHQLYEQSFTVLEMPKVDGIEDYVSNWASLEPRHRKQVALSVAPWAAYIPVLLEAGSHHYIKPLHERLSEAPDQNLLSDVRISYDSRLWDDVRGVGGYQTVTGVEDVERIPWNGYNTVLHELTHQVHQVLPAEENRRIQDLYRRTKQRDEREGGEVFLSRYAAGSVWEYFAEGANSLESPRRDRFDSREIVRERLEEKDPELLALVRELMQGKDLAGAYTVAWVNRGSHHLRWGRAEQAITALEKAWRRSPESEEALSNLSHAYNVSGRADESLRLLEQPVQARPESGDLAMAYAISLWLAGRGLGTARFMLKEARSQVREEERFQLDLQLGSWAWTAGDASGAREAYEAVLAYQSDHPQGLWGLASAHALAGNWPQAWPRYEEAVRHRTGIVGLRVGYAADLMRAGELDQARLQLDAALLLDPDDPDVLAQEAFWFLASGQLKEALRSSERALDIGPWSDSARLARARSLTGVEQEAAGREILAPLEQRLSEEMPPEYMYRADKGYYELIHTLPKWLKDEARDFQIVSE